MNAGDGASGDAALRSGMPALRLRAATAADRDFAEALSREHMAPYRAARGIAWEPARFAASWDGFENWIVLADGHAVGVLRVLVEGDALAIRDLQIVPAMRGQGVGGWALGEARRLARVRGCAALVLRVFADNPARQLYLRHGFVHVGTDAGVWQMRCALDADAAVGLPWHTQRLCLRRLHGGDVEAFHACRSDARVARLQGWAPFTREQSQAFVAAEADGAFPVFGGWRQLAIARRADDTLLGDAGVWLADDGSEAEFGLSLMHAVQGQGFGSEAVTGLLGLLFTATPVQRVHACTDARNIPCRAALVHAGMTCVGTQQIEAKGEHCTEWQFAIERAGWHAPASPVAAT